MLHQIFFLFFFLHPSMSITTYDCKTLSPLMFKCGQFDLDLISHKLLTITAICNDTKLTLTITAELYKFMGLNFNELEGGGVNGFIGMYIEFRGFLYTSTFKIFCCHFIFVG